MPRRLYQAVLLNAPSPRRPSWRVAAPSAPFHRAAAILGLAPVLALCLVACDLDEGAAEPSSEGPDGSAARPLFVERAAEAGLDFRHDNGATGQFYYPELMQGGAAFLDYDNDEDLDVYLVQSGPLPPPAAGHPAAANRLYRNLGNPNDDPQSESQSESRRGGPVFEDVTAASGLGDRGYGSGVAVADFDSDGFVDVYVTNLGRNRLYRNRGDGSFEDVTDRAAVGDPGYSTSATFFDADQDGDLDLYVCNYVEWSPALETECLGFHGLRGYCNPGEYPPQRDTLYRNEGNGRFRDVTVEAGLGGAVANGLGVVAGDLTGDGLVDLYVANDQMANFLWVNQGDGRFTDEALLRGAAFNEQGQAEAGMGVIAEDFDLDGDLDLFVTHLSGETNTLYRNDGGAFLDVTDRWRLGAVSQPYTGFGVGLFDFDLDGHRDLFLANGKVSPGDSVAPEYQEPDQLLFGLGDGGFAPRPEVTGALSPDLVSRAAAFGDFDGDGDVDVLVAHNDAVPRLYENQTLDGAAIAESDRHWLIVELRGGPGRDRDAIGSRIEIEIGDGVESESRTLVRQIQPTASYCASNEPSAHFGLGEIGRVERVRVLWPDGRITERRDVAADRRLRISDPAGGR